MRKKLYQIKNAIKYFFKTRKIKSEKLYRCERLYHGGYMSKKTYEKILKDI